MTSTPPRPTLADLDLESLTTDRLIALVRRHRENEDYPTSEQPLTNPPVVLRALYDYLLSGQATALNTAYRIASIIDAGALSTTSALVRTASRAV